MLTRELFVMISRTDTLMGKVIRLASRYPYNHVSVTLDPSLRFWYSFARYAEDAPFYGGFIRESAERFLAASPDAQVRIFRLEIPDAQARKLEGMIHLANLPDSGLLYNYYDALASTVGMGISLPDSHTCLSFACGILQKDHRSIRALDTELTPHLIYEGSYGALVRDSGCREDPYFRHIGLRRGFTNSTAQLARLSGRLLRQAFERYMARRSRHTIQ